MTAVAEDLDLSFVTFTAGGGDDDCEGDGDGACSLEAIVLLIFVTSCDHDRPDQRACVAHRDKFVAAAAETDGAFQCGTCGAVAHLIRIEPIR